MSHLSRPRVANSAITLSRGPTHGTRRGRRGHEKTARNRKSAYRALRSGRHASHEGIGYHNSFEPRGAPSVDKRRTHQTQERHRCEVSEEISCRREDQEMQTLCSRPFAVASLAIGALTLSALQTQGGDFTFTQTNLVSDIPGLATITDPQLVNPWGVSHSPMSPFWISNQGTNTATLYKVTDETTVTKVDITVAIPTTESGGPQGPTGQVNNTNTDSFPVAHDDGTDGTSARFIFANLNGTISAWDGGPTAFVQNSGADGTVYTGLAINQAQTRLYAANSLGRIDVFDSNFAALDLGPDAFVDPSLPHGLVPFNVRDIDGFVYVVYAPAGREAQTMADLGAGAVAVFEEDGTFINEVVVGSRLAAPWGITFAPPSFGRFAFHLLVGNFSYLHSEINAFDPTTGELRGTIPIDTGDQQAGGLWAIDFGIGGNNGSPDVLYFSDGINGEADGLFGAIAVAADGAIAADGAMAAR